MKKYNSRTLYDIVSTIFGRYFHYDMDYSPADKREMFDIVAQLCLFYVIRNPERY